jgi:hypothetical protein
MTHQFWLAPCTVDSALPDAHHSYSGIKAIKRLELHEHPTSGPKATRPSTSIRGAPSRPPTSKDAAVSATVALAGVI